MPHAEVVDFAKEIFVADSKVKNVSKIIVNIFKAMGIETHEIKYIEEANLKF